MLLEIRHETRYRYDRPVRESVMEVWAQPRQTPSQRLTRFSLETEPAAQLFSYADAFGNAVYHFDVPQPHDALHVRVSSSVETRAPAQPPASLPRESWEALRSEEARGEHFDFLQPHGFARPTSLFQRFLRRLGLAEPPPADPLTAVRALSERLYGALDYEAGVTRADSPIDHALQERRGVCQDFAHIMIAACRAWDVPARYVSGYLFTDRAAGDRSDPDATHAWVEAFLPGALWVGFDPTNNCLAGERHVAVAIGRDYGDVPPTRGVYKGAAADELTVAVNVRQASGRAVQSEFAGSARVVISGQGRRLAPPPALLEAQLLQQQ